jgi:DNA-binding beta-propeller fold protein YncE
MTRNTHDILRRLAGGTCLAAALTLSVVLAGCASGSKTEQPAAVEYEFWPPFPQEPRIQFLTSFEYSSDIEPPKSGMEELVYGKEIQAVLLINKPYGVAMIDGKIYVCDTRNVNVTILDLVKQEVRLMGVRGSGRLMKPIAICIAPDGMKYVADASRGVIFVYDAEDRFLTTFGHERLKPVAVAVHDDKLYISDFQNHYVEIMDRFTGEVLGNTGEPGRERGQIAGPLGLGVGPDGTLWVSDIMNCRLQAFDTDGNVLKVIGGRGDSPGTFTRPKHLAVDDRGYVYIVDAAFENVQMFDDQGQLLLNFGGGGDSLGAMDLPAGICVYSGNLDLFAKYVHPAFQIEKLIIVTNQFGTKKVSVYGLGQLREGKTVRDIAGSIAKPPTDQAAEKKSIFSGIPSEPMPIEGVDEAQPPSPEPTPPTP